MVEIFDLLSDLESFLEVRDVAHLAAHLSHAAHELMSFSPQSLMVVWENESSELFVVENVVS